MLPRLARSSLITLALLGAVSAGLAQTRPPAPASPEIDASYAKLLDAPLLKKLLADVKADDARTLAELRTITEIEAPPFKEKARAEYMLGRFKALGLTDAKIDAEGSVVGLRKGSGIAGRSGPLLVVSAHLDTVFPAGTDVKVKEKGTRWYAPGCPTFRSFTGPTRARCPTASRRRPIWRGAWWRSAAG